MDTDVPQDTAGCHSLGNVSKPLTLTVLLYIFWHIIGIIKTALPNMDREAKDQYLLVIQAKDMVGQNGGLSGTTSVTVTLTDVNDNPPRFPRSKFLHMKIESGQYFLQFPTDIGLLFVQTRLKEECPVWLKLYSTNCTA